MNITELRYLVAIKKWGSVSAAAKQLYAAQPNVSKALKNLEGEYGLRIFERSSTGMIPTEQGRRFIEQAERVLEDVDRLSRSVEEEQERCAELRVMLPHATYASYAAVDYLAAPFEWFKEKVIGEITKYMKSLMTKILQSVGINIGGTTGATAAETDMFQSTLNGMFGNAAGEAIGSVITFVGWVYLAYQIADLVIQLVYKCEQSEYELVSKRDTKNCHYIGLSLIHI